MSKAKYGALVKAGIFAIFAIQFEMGLTTPALGAIALAYPDVNPDLIKQIASLPYLITILAAPISAFLVRKKGLKFTLNVGMIILFIGGILPGFFGDIYFILACRVVFGFGYGFMFTLGPTVVNDLFEGREKEDMMGYQSAVGAFSGVIYGILGGILAGIFWRYAFLGFIIMIPLMILVMVAVPNPPAKEPVKEAERKSGPTMQTWLYSVLTVLAFILIFSWISNVPIVIALEKVGVPAQIGLVMSVFTIGAAIGGLTFGKFSDIFKRYHAAFSIIVSGIGILGAYYSISITMFFISGIIFGIGFINFSCRLYVLGAQTIPDNQPLGVSFMISASCLGQFLSPIVLSVLTAAFGLTSLRAAWLLSWPLLIIAGVVMIAIIAVSKPKDFSAKA